MPMVTGLDILLEGAAAEALAGGLFKPQLWSYGASHRLVWERGS